MTEKTILHIAAHMGGGVGKVLSNVAIRDSNYEHKIILLEKPMDTQYSDKCRKNGVDLYIEPNKYELRSMADDSDIVQFDWWAHPLLYKTMRELLDIHMRSVIWSHTAGITYPHIHRSLVGLPDHFIVSSAYSLQNPSFQGFPNISVVHSSGGFEETRGVDLQPHDGFNIGYVGTLGYVKLRPDFMEYCKAVADDIRDVKFIMIGRIPEPNNVLEDAKKYGIADKFVFKGWVSDLSRELAQLDVLGYILNKDNFGTTENALLEAMSIGIPPVVMDQCTERTLIDSWCGVLVNNSQRYAEVMRTLYNSEEARKEIGRNARHYVLHNFGLESTINKLDAVYDSVMQYKKHANLFGRAIGTTPQEWYNSCQPYAINDFNKYLVDSTKGSKAQWNKYFPGEVS